MSGTDVTEWSGAVTVATTVVCSARGENSGSKAEVDEMNEVRRKATNVVYTDNILVYISML